MALWNQILNCPFEQFCAILSFCAEVQIVTSGPLQNKVKREHGSDHAKFPDLRESQFLFILEKNSDFESEHIRVLLSTFHYSKQTNLCIFPSKVQRWMKWKQLVKQEIAP